MHPVIEIFGKQIASYGLCALIGILVCSIVGFLLTRKKNVPSEDLIVMYVYIVLGMVAGGHILYGITNIVPIAELFRDAGKFTAIEFFKTLFLGYLGGMVFYGGLLGGTAALMLTCRFSKFGNKAMYDVFAVCVPLFHFFGRIGCSLAGCCYGVESEFGYTVHNNTIIPAVNDVQRFPVQLIEAAFNLIIFAVLLTLYLKKKFPDRLLIVYFMIYPVVRFVLEFFRDDEIRGKIGGLSTSQIISLLLLIFAVVFSVIDRKKKIKQGA